jgi:hypothetical protein
MRVIEAQCSWSWRLPITSHIKQERIPGKAIFGVNVRLRVSGQLPDPFGKRTEILEQLPLAERSWRPSAMPGRQSCRLTGQALPENWRLLFGHIGWDALTGQPRRSIGSRRIPSSMSKCPQQARNPRACKGLLAVAPWPRWSRRPRAGLSPAPEAPGTRWPEDDTSMFSRVPSGWPGRRRQEDLTC